MEVASAAREAMGVAVEGGVAALWAAWAPTASAQPVVAHTAEERDTDHSDGDSDAATGQLCSQRGLRTGRTICDLHT